MIGIRFPILVLCALLAVSLALPARMALGASYAVDTTDNDLALALTACTGAAADCSLRGAITAANGSGPGDTISFDPSISGMTITLASTNPPALTAGGDTIDGTGSGLTIRGDGEPWFGSCLILQSAGNTVKGLQVTDCSIGIVLDSFSGADNNVIGPGNLLFDNNSAIATRDDATGNHIVGNKVGTTADGSAVHPDGGNGQGIFIGSSNNTVGGPEATDRNIIAGSAGSGVALRGAGAMGNTIIGNYIGTSASGMTDLGNGYGVSITNSTSNNVVQGNLISGNDPANVIISLTSANNTLTNNIIGSDVTGSGAAMTNGTGVDIAGAANNNTIGPGNVISDATAGDAGGVLIRDAGTTANVVKGNFIGTNPAGTAGVPNSRGVLIDFDAAANTIGGAAPGDANVIAFNTMEGVKVDGTSSTANAIRGNSIHHNSGPGIDLAGDGVTPNDVGDADAGPNGLQNFPVLTNIIIGGGNTSIAWTLDSSTFTQFTFEFFYSSSCDASGHGEGETFIGDSAQMTGGGLTNLNATFPGEVTAARFITATATNAAGNTSEFSACIASVNDADDDDDGYTDVAESGTPLCANSLNDDNLAVPSDDARVGDGCPAVGPPEDDCTDTASTGPPLDDDGDGANNDGCPQDGAYSEAQFKIGTNHQDPCGNDGWPNDLYTVGPSLNKFDLLDLSSFVANPRRLNRTRGEAGFNSRWDTVPGAAAGDFINLVDMSAMIPGAQIRTARPPMLGGAPAFDQTCPFPP